jgi:hypothetical protein
MAHFVKLNSDNIVLAISTVDNDILLDENGIEQESKGVSFLQEIHGWLDWKQTSYNTSKGKYYVDGILGEDQTKAFRKNYAGIGFKYDSVRDAFIPPQPYASWTLNETTCHWEAPVTYPSIVEDYLVDWDEINQRWTATDIDNNNFIWNSTTLSWDAS